MKNYRSFWKYTYLIFLLMPTLYSHGQAPETYSQEALQQFSTFYQKTLQDNNAVGSMVWLFKDGEVVFKDTYGLANREESRPMDENAIFHWASITKPFTAIGILQLRDRGLLSLNDPVTKYIPELRQVHNPYGSMDSITIYHLMTHSAGFRSSTWPWRDHEWQPLNAKTWEQLEALFPYTQIFFPPGSKWQYSNPGLCFLGRIIELITNDDYEYYIQKNIFTPLGMHQSYFDRAPFHLLPQVCQSYDIDKAGNISPAIFDLDTEVTVSNGGLSSSFPDMMKYINFLLGNGDQANYDQVLKRSTLEEMFVPQLPTGSTLHGKGKEYQGLMYFVEDIFDMKIVGHSGWQNGFHTHMYFDPEHNQAYLIGYNFTSSNNRKMDADIKEYIFKKFFLPAWNND